MNKKLIISLGLCTFVAVCLLIVLVLILVRLGNFMETAAGLRQMVELLETENIDLKQQLNVAPAPPPGALSAVEAISRSSSRIRTLGFAGILLATLLVVGCLAAIFLHFRFSNDLHREQTEKARKLKKQAYQAGYTDALKKLVVKTDVLSNIVRWLSQYENGKATIDDAALLQRKLLTHLASAYDLEPIGEVGKITGFTPVNQQTYDRISTGEKVVVVKPGWRLGGHAIEQPVVSKRRRQI